MEYTSQQISNSDQKSPMGMNLLQNSTVKKEKKLKDLNEMRSIRNKNRHDSKYMSQYTDFSQGKEMQTLLHLQNKINQVDTHGKDFMFIEENNNDSRNAATSNKMQYSSNFNSAQKERIDPHNFKQNKES